MPAATGTVTGPSEPLNHEITSDLVTTTQELLTQPVKVSSKLVVVVLRAAACEDMIPLFSPV